MPTHVQSLSAFVFVILFWPGIAGAATTPRWAFLAVVVPAVLWFRQIKNITLAHLLLGCFLAWGGVSFFWGTVGYDWALTYAHFLMMAGLFVIAAEMKSVRGMIAGATVAMAVNSAVCYAQIQGWQGLGQLVKPGGLFLNRNVGSETAALLLIALVYKRMWWGIPLVLPSFIMQNNRGATAALIVVAALALLRTRPKILVAVVSVAAAFVSLHYIKYWDGPVDERFSIWFDTIDGYRWLGHGLGQFYGTYPSVATRIDTLAQRPDHAHNDLLELGYELGIGFVFVLAFVRSIWRNSLATEKAVLIAFAVEGMFGFPLYMPTTAAIFAVVAGRLAGAGPSLRDDLYAGRRLLRNWLERISDFCRGGKEHADGRPAVSAGIPHQELGWLPVRSGDREGCRPWDGSFKTEKCDQV